MKLIWHFACFYVDQTPFYEWFLFITSTPKHRQGASEEAMAQLKDKIKTTLDEGRMVILGAQVLLGFQFRSIFEKGFEKLPAHAQYVKLGGLGLMLLAVV